jgi:hypothetical protein
VLASYRGTPCTLATTREIGSHLPGHGCSWCQYICVHGSSAKSGILCQIFRLLQCDDRGRGAPFIYFIAGALYFLLSTLFFFFIPDISGLNLGWVGVGGFC